MKLRRDVASIPERSAKETWQVITDLVTDLHTVDRPQLDAAASIMESLIADELPATQPIVFKGSGPRVVVYCLYGEDALDAGLEVDPLPKRPTSGDWLASAPCEPEDAEWMNDCLRSKAPRISVYDATEGPGEEKDGEAGGKSGVALEVNWGALEES